VIFVTVGTQGPFDRLVSAVDRWAAARPERRVFAQIGPSDLCPRHIESRQFISPEECRRRIRDAEAVVAHAGMGTILSALELGTPVLVMPRRAALGEQRNDHQVATARRFKELGGVGVAFDEHELAHRLGEVERLVGGRRIGRYASDRFIGALRTFIDAEPTPGRRVPLTDAAAPST
jgi:UDP-N-acetylglucosamine transferase subunit ALG13